MAVLLLITAIVSSVFQLWMNKLFGNREGLDALTFSAMQAFFAMIFFLCFTKNFTVTGGVLLFSGGFALVWGICTVFGILALRYGPLSRTSLVVSFSMLLPSLFGIFFLDEALKIPLLIGTVFLAVSLFLVNYEKSAAKITVAWVICVAVTFFTNGGCSIVQRMEQVVCDGETYSNIFMVIALAFCTVSLLLIALIRVGAKAVLETVKRSWFSALAVGGTNGLLNLLIIKLNGLMPASVLFSTFAAGSLVLGIVVSYFFFHERFTKKQIIGFAAGVVAVVLLNL